MIITVDISMYPLDAEYGPPIIDFIRDLRTHPGIEVITNALSTQVRGEFDAVTRALNASMREHMERDARVVFVTKHLNIDLPIANPGDLG